MNGRILMFAGLGTALILLSARKAQAVSSSQWPAFIPTPETNGFGPRRYITNAERDARFGPLEWYHAPSSTNPERVVITNQFANANLIDRHYPELGKTITIHRAAAEPLQSVLDELSENGELGLIRTFDGTYNPRLVRGSSTSLSSHAYATSIDVNAGENPMGSPPTENQRKLATVFEDHGWYWGDRFSRRDPMHFEWVG